VDRAVLLAILIHEITRTRSVIGRWHKQWSAAFAYNEWVKLKLAPGLSIRKSPISGKGCFAIKPFPRRKKIAEYTGERISDLEARKRARGRRHLRICDIDGRFSLDGARGGNGTHYINHSCDPNAYMKTLHGHVLFFARRDIKAGEEITVDYEETLLPDSRRCHCGAGNCRGTINRL
jgi:uncharacterized protein